MKPAITMENTNKLPKGNQILKIKFNFSLLGNPNEQRAILCQKEIGIVTWEVGVAIKRVLILSSHSTNWQFI